eukprot:Rhum_TRINITY_DN2081_c0_g1::Rhum_TRINITY_DN2081_c0_g1_i1::g.5757::m.5757
MVHPLTAMRLVFGCLLLATECVSKQEGWAQCLHTWSGSCSKQPECVASKLIFPYRCLPAAFADQIDDTCSDSTLFSILSALLHERDLRECAWANCLKNGPSACDGIKQLGARACWWHKNACIEKGVTDALIAEKAEAFGKVVTSGAKDVHQCAAEALSKEGLTTRLPTFGCGPSAVSPDCVTGVMSMGEGALRCAEATMTSRLQKYYDDYLRLEVESTEDIYDCTAEAVKRCPHYGVRDLCFAVEGDLRRTSECFAYYTCFAQQYNTCADGSFALFGSLPVVSVSPLQGSMNDCLKVFSRECGGSLSDVQRKCSTFTDVVGCVENQACYLNHSGPCLVKIIREQMGPEYDFSDLDWGATLDGFGRALVKDARCYSEELQACGFEKGFCSNGVLESGADVVACLRDMTCMMKAVGPCTAVPLAILVASEVAEKLAGGPQNCGNVVYACQTLCDAYPFDRNCKPACRVETYLRCSLSDSYSYNATGVDIDQTMKDALCLVSAAGQCGYDEHTFCKISGDAPTAAEAVACNTQIECTAKVTSRCLEAPDSPVAALLAKVDLVAMLQHRYDDKFRATRTCIEEKEVTCDAKINDLGFDTALCLARPEECTVRARCVVKQAHQCGVQTGLLRSAAQDLLESTTYSRCMLVAFNGTDLAQEVAELDSDFFFHPSTRLMQAHARCAGWPLSKLERLLPDSLLDPVRREVSSAEFCSRSLASICAPFADEAAATAACAVAAVYRCRDGTAFNKRVDSCFTDAASACGAVEGVATWANVQGVDCVADASRCAELAACLTVKVSACLGKYAGEASARATGFLEREMGLAFGSSKPNKEDDGGGPPVLAIAVAAGAGVLAMLAAVGGVALYRRSSAPQTRATENDPGSDLGDLTELVGEYAVAE